MEILRLDNFSVTYDGVRFAADHVSLDVQKGEIVSIVGESGSGKSTVLHGILGLLPQNAVCSGSCRLFDRELATLSAQELRSMRGSRVSVIFQDTGRYLNPIARIGKQYRDFLRCHGIRSEQERLALEREQLRKLHLHNPDRILDAYPFELSGGMRQRVGIAMAMSLQPELLLADEPTSALDVTVQAQVIRQMLELRQRYGTTIIMVTHNMGVAAYISDRIAVMQNGKLVEWGPTETVIGAPKEAYTSDLLDAIVELDDERLRKR